MNYRNEFVSLETNSSIIEYDIKSAGTSLMRYYNLADEKTISRLESYPKNKRVVETGLFLRKNPDISKQLNSAFDNIVKEFIKANELIKDTDIISIKKDAVFVINSDIFVTEFDNVKFVKKNEYSSYLYIKPYEFYISSNKIDVKGLNDDVIKYHKNGILNLINTFIDVYSSAYNISNNNMPINKFMKEFVTAYKDRALDCEYYREFNSDSGFRTIVGGSEYVTTLISNDDIDDLDISYNYSKIIIPLCNLIL